jgi:hypothetical protein
MGLTELNASSGSVLGMFNNHSGAIGLPTSMAVSGDHVWISSPLDITEYDLANGSWVRTFDMYTGSQTGQTKTIAVSGSQVWVTNTYENSVTVFNAESGALIRTIDAPADHLVDPKGIVIAKSHVWVVNSSGAAGSDTRFGSVTELNESNGALVKVVSFQTNKMIAPIIVSVHRDVLWVANGEGSVAELNMSSASVKKYLTTTTGSTQFTAMAVGNSHLWLTGANTNSVTESYASSIVRLINSTILRRLQSSERICGSQIIAETR